VIITHKRDNNLDKTQGPIVKMNHPQAEMHHRQWLKEKFQDDSFLTLTHPSPQGGESEGEWVTLTMVKMGTLGQREITADRRYGKV
jgi:desulfoferrodoxin (superoxide reductase-like protein)